MTGDPEWEYRLAFLDSEGYAGRSAVENLERLGEIDEIIARDAEISQERDGVRGKKIIADYEQANTQTPDDGFVKEPREKSKTAGEELEKLAARLDGS